MDRPRFVRSLLLVWLSLALLLAGVTWWLADNGIESRVAATRDAETRNLERAVGAVSTVVEAVGRDVRFLATHGALRAAVETDSQAALDALTASFVAFSNTQRFYDQIRWIDETGQERVRVDLIDGSATIVPRERLQNTARRPYFIQTMALAEGDVHVAPPDPGAERDRVEAPSGPMLRVGMPVFDHGGRRRGMVVLNYYGSEMLAVFARAASTTAPRAMLLDYNARWLRAPDSSGEASDASTSGETFAARHPQVWARVRAAERGQFDDALGIWTFATVRPLAAGDKAGVRWSARSPAGAGEHAPSDYLWKAVAHVPTTQLAAYRTEIWTQYAPVLAFLLLLALLASARVAQVLEQRRSADEELRQSHAELERKVVERTELLAEREREHVQILEDSPFAIVVLRLTDAAIVYANPALLALLGIDRAAAQALTVDHLFVDAAEGEALLVALRRTGRAEGELRLRAAGGREIDTLAAARATRFASEPAVIASIVDITERKHAEHALADSQQRYRQLFEAESDAILLIENGTGRILEANAAASRLYGYTADELRSMCNHELSAEPEATRAVSQSSPLDVSRMVMIPLRLHRRRDGTVFPVEITGRFFELGGQGVHVAAIRDISTRLEAENALREANAKLSQQLAEIETLQASLKEQAIRDGLTGLFNRRFLEETCGRELARAQREGYPVALAMFDLDLFKRINDTYGHAAGDEVIIALARLLQQQARSSDTACRFGGEEFVLLLPGIDLETAAARVDELRLAFADAVIAFGAFRLRSTVSAGVAAYPAHGLSTRELVGRADEALYRAKRSGRDRVEIWSEASQSV